MSSPELLASASLSRVRSNHPTVPFHRAWLGRRESLAVTHALRRGVLQGNGSICRVVEARLQDQCGVRHALLMTSGTAALSAVLTALDVRGRDVIVPSLTFASVAGAIVGAGGRPVFVDIEAHQLGLDPARVARAITGRTRAILHVEYGGWPGAIDDLRRLAARHDLPLIEDTAQGFGSQLRGRPLGAWGVAAILSFHETKIATCGEGGALLTNDDHLAQAAVSFREYGTNRSACLRGEVDHYEWQGPGSSALLAEPLAALLETQLSRLPEIIARRRTIAAEYLRAFTPLAAAGYLQLPPVPDNADLAWHTFFLLMRDRMAAEALIASLARRGIAAHRHFVPLHRSPCARRLGLTPPEPLPVTESVAGRLVRLPIYPTLTRVQRRVVARRVVAFFTRDLANGTGRTDH